MSVVTRWRLVLFMHVISGKVCLLFVLGLETNAGGRSIAACKYCWGVLMVKFARLSVLRCAVSMMHVSALFPSPFFPVALCICFLTVHFLSILALVFYQVVSVVLPALLLRASYKAPILTFFRSCGGGGDGGGGGGGDVCFRVFVTLRCFISHFHLLCCLLVVAL